MSNKNKSEDPNDPGPEARSRIVNELVPKLLTHKTLGVKPMGDLAELIELRKKKDSAKEKVIALVQPIIRIALEESPSSPNYAHSAQGRARLTMTAQKFYIDEVKSWSRDELIWMLSLEYASYTVGQFL